MIDFVLLLALLSHLILDGISFGNSISEGLHVRRLPLVELDELLVEVGHDFVVLLLVFGHLVHQLVVLVPELAPLQRHAVVQERATVRSVDAFLPLLGTRIFDDVDLMNGSSIQCICMDRKHGAGSGGVCRAAVAAHPPRCTEIEQLEALGMALDLAQGLAQGLPSITRHHPLDLGLQCTVPEAKVQAALIITNCIRRSPAGCIVGAAVQLQKLGMVLLACGHGKEEFEHREVVLPLSQLPLVLESR
mmetsp:Transcript_129980/g.277607  ORF Transcript_129980/g.277607 Transcript_129980/m.277607 type:complete len:247 (+) Transcript_129980:1598-2338(+)